MPPPQKGPGRPSCAPSACSACAWRVCWEGIPPRRRNLGRATLDGFAPHGARDFQHEPVATQQATTPRPRSPSEQGLSRAHGRAGRGRARGPLGGRLRHLDRRLRAAARLAEAARARIAVRGPRRRRHPPRLHPVQRAAPPDRGQPHPQGAQGRHGGDRGRALLPPQGRRLRGHRARRGQEPLEPQDRAGRLDDHDAARAQPLHHQGAHVPAQDPRGQARRGARERALQGVDPRQVPQHGAVRHAGRPDRRRCPGRLARVLREVRRGPQAARGRAAGRPAPGAHHVLAGARAREGRGPPQRGAGQDGRPQDDHAADGAEGDEARARRQPLPLLHRPPRIVLLRLRQGRADQGVRRQDGAPGRTARGHHDRPQEAAGRAGGDQRPARRHRPLRRDRHDRPQERLHQGDGVVRGLRQVEVQPRRPGPPPAGFHVQGHGADDRPAQGRQPAVDELRLEAARSSPTRSGARSRRRPTTAPTAAR